MVTTGTIGVKETIFAYALSRVSNKEDAEDLTNDIVLAFCVRENTKVATEEATKNVATGKNRMMGEESVFTK